MFKAKYNAGDEVFFFSCLDCFELDLPKDEMVKFGVIKDVISKFPKSAPPLTEILYKFHIKEKLFGEYISYIPEKNIIGVL